MVRLLVKYVRLYVTNNRLIDRERRVTRLPREGRIPRKLSWTHFDELALIRRNMSATQLVG